MLFSTSNSGLTSRALTFGCWTLQPGSRNLDCESSTIANKLTKYAQISMKSAGAYTIHKPATHRRGWWLRLRCQTRICVAVIFPDFEAWGHKIFSLKHPRNHPRVRGRAHSRQLFRTHVRYRHHFPKAFAFWRERFNRHRVATEAHWFHIPSTARRDFVRL